MAKKNKLEDLKYFVSKLITEQQNEHSVLIASLREAIGKTKGFDDTVSVLNQVYSAKIELLQLIYKEMLKL